ncbi:MAG TPA: hypothetical protein H9881_14495 [Candidatus Stackebrandtia excrementipullorum]|nr:hypothetical protein [Candidatus Stackebrandtia excrementipullorum]
MTRREIHGRDERLPARMRDYRIAAEPRQSPDLHQLAQLFIGMAVARTEHHRPEPDSTGQTLPTGPYGHGPVGGDEVESEQQEANG